MKALWAFLHGMGHFASFVLPKADQFYPYAFPEEALTSGWESAGDNIKKAIKQYQGEATHVR